MSVREKIQLLKSKFERLKKDYDQFFAGLLKKEPVELRGEVEALIRELSQKRIVNTGDKYLFQSICASYTSYTTLWNRKLRAIMDTSHVEKELLQKAPVKKKAAFQSQPVADPIKEAAKKYIEAHKQLGLRLKIEDENKLAETIRKNVETIKKKYNARDVNVRVKVEGGKVKITVKPVC